MTTVIRLFALTALLISSTAWAVGEPQPMNRADFEALLKEISNWGRWGADDQLGTLNLITPAKRKAAAALVEDGLSVSLALNLNKQPSDLNVNPFEHEVTSLEFDGFQAAVDRYAVDYHGFAHSHMDGLAHFAYNGKMYNDVPFAGIRPEGTKRLGVENIGVNGIFTRGVLIDMPRFLEVDYLPAGTTITASDLDAWEKASGVKISSGDVLLIRTGRWQQLKKSGQWDISQKAAGLHASVSAWLKERDVAVIGCDGISDVMPSGVEGLLNPLHILVLVGLGMPILDNLDLESLAEVAAERKRPTFLFVGAPLRVPGGTGSPLNPLAIF